MTKPARSPSARRCRRRSGWSRVSMLASPRPAATTVGRAVSAWLHHRHQHHPGAHGAKTALLITGFRDVYEMAASTGGRIQSLLQEHVPLVERALRFEVKERVLADGEVETPLDQAEIATLGKALEQRRHRGCAILFLNCYASPAHEARKGNPGEEPSRHVRVGLARAQPGISRVRALLNGSCQRLYRTGVAAMSARSTITSVTKALPARS